MTRILAAVAGALLVAIAGPNADQTTAISGATSASVPAAGIAVLATTAGPEASTAVPAPVGYSAPLVPLRVIHGFDPPATRYGPGHLGVDLASSSGAPVRAAGAGVVRFAGAVAGRGVVVVQHADGISTEYEPVLASVQVGAVVTGATVLGVVRGTHRGCSPGRCLHWGARRGGEYLDPLLLLEALGPVRLLPWSGDP